MNATLLVCDVQERERLLEGRERVGAEIERAQAQSRAGTSRRETRIFHLPDPFRRAVLGGVG